MNDEQRRTEHNATVARILREQKERRGYAIVTIGTGLRHASIDTIKGWGGYIHPRTLCQPHTPRSYAGVWDELQGLEVGCKRCIAGLQKRKIA